MKMNATARLLCLAFVAGSASAPRPAVAQADITEYTANYDVEYRGRRAARAEFGVSADGDGQYLFRSSTEARGIYKLASPKPALESSRFRVDGGEIRPLRFDYEDGSRKGEDNYGIEFDSADGRVRVAAPGGPLELPFEPGLLDRGSLQVALMRDAGECRLPGPYRYVDDDGVRSYHYERLEDMTAGTDAGNFATIRFAQRREGSSRSTVLWLAPALSHLPVRIEQFRDGELETVFSLTAFAGIQVEESACSNSAADG